MDTYLPYTEDDAGETTREWQDLADAMGSVILNALESPAESDVTDIRRRASDGAIMIKRGGKWRKEGTLNDRKAMNVLTFAAGYAGRKIRPDMPRVSAVMPGTRGRLKGAIAPVAFGPTFAIRRPSGKVWPLEGYVDAGIMTARQYQWLMSRVTSGRNVQCAGKPGAGKTSLLNSIFATSHFAGKHVYAIEDDPELVLPEDHTRMLADDTLPKPVTMQHLCSDALRWAPDVVTIGEVRGMEGLQVVELANGGMQLLGTVHASSARNVIGRYKRLVEMNKGVNVTMDEIVAAVQTAVYLENENGKPVVSEIVGFEWDEGRAEVIATPLS
jgi:type IV secretion system protein VirB11